MRVMACLEVLGEVEGSEVKEFRDPACAAMMELVGKEEGGR